MNQEGYEFHLFVCTNCKEKGKCCASQDTPILREELKKAFAVKFPKKIRVNASGCLGYCERGGAAVLYPQGKWFFGLSKDSLKDLDNEISSILEGSSKSEA